MIDFRTTNIDYLFNEFPITLGLPVWATLTFTGHGI